MKTVRLPIVVFSLIVFMVGLSSWAPAQESDVSFLKERIINLQNRYPLGIRILVPCSKVMDYGSYEPWPDNTVKAGDVVFFYFEPENPSTKKEEGTYEIWLTQDVVILNANQEEMYKQEDFIEIHYQTSSPRLDIYGANQLTFSKVPPGKYLLKVILHDKIKGEVTSATWAFEVVE